MSTAAASLHGVARPLGAGAEPRCHLRLPRAAHCNRHLKRIPQPPFPSHAGGVPGVGKTQLCMQLCLDVQMPAVVGGVAGSAVYIDTEGSLMPPRLEQMAAAVARHLYILRTRGRYAAPRDGSGSSGAADPGKVLDGISAKSLLEAIHVFRCTTMEEQMGTVFGLLPFLEAHPQVRLVVLDSVAFHARYSLDTLDLATRARHLQALSQALHRMAAHYDVAVVVINQMTTKFGGEREGGGTGGGGGSAGGGGQSKDAHEEEESGGGGGGGGGAGGGDDSSRLVPALGDTWAHACTSRILLQWVDGKRTAVLIKSPSQKPGVATFGVFADGVRGPHYKPSKSSSTSSSSTGGTVASHTASAAPATPAPAVTPAPLLAPAPAPVPASASAAAVAQPAPTRPVYSIPLSDLKPIPGVTNVIISSGPSASAPAPASTAAVAAALSGVKRNAAEAQLPQPARR